MDIDLIAKLKDTDSFMEAYQLGGEEAGMTTELYELLEQRRDSESSQKGFRGKLKAVGAAIFGKPTQNQELLDCDEDTLAHLYDYVMSRKADFVPVCSSRAAVTQSSANQSPFLPV